MQTQTMRRDGVENPEDLRRLKANLTAMNLTGPKKKDGIHWNLD